MDIIPTKNLEGILFAFKNGYRRCLLEGGTSSSKTWGAMQALILIAERATDPLVISCVSESLPHLKRGVIRDLSNILGEDLDNNPYYSKTESRYSRPGWKGVFEFFGADQSDKVRGPRRQILFINEGNNVPWETARGLDIRTSLFTIVDWNPVGQFWAHDYWLPDYAQTEEDREERIKSNYYIHSTYLDSRNVLPSQVITDIESYKDKDPNWWNIYGLGLIGKIEGLVYPNFQQVDALPLGPYFYGLDFGFGSYEPSGSIGGDPTVLVKNVIIGENLYSQQLIYSRQAMTNDDIAREMKLLKVSPDDPIYPDPNEPKSAEEIKQKGFNVQPTEKGPGSVKFGIKRVNQYYQFWTKDSIDCIKDQRNCRYIKRTDKETGREFWSDDITHTWSHGMDARRYAVASNGMGRDRLWKTTVSHRSR